MSLGLYDMLLTLRWTGAFVDAESGIAFYDWSVGSLPGHADIMPFARTETAQEMSPSDQALSLREGHSYFVTIRVIITKCRFRTKQAKLVSRIRNGFSFMITL